MANLNSFFKTILKNIKVDKRYDDFTYLDHPVLFRDLFKNKAYDIVQIHDMSPISGSILSIVGFCGQFKWNNNVIESLDGDSYTSLMPVWGYHEFIHEENVCLDVLVSEW